MSTLVQFHLWRTQSMDHCRLVAPVYVMCLNVCVCGHACMQAFCTILSALLCVSAHNAACPSLSTVLPKTLSTQHTPLHLVSVCMHYVLGIASVSLCWSRQSWARPTDNHEEEETEELSQQRQQQRGHHRQQETQPRHQLQPLQSGTCKHQLHSVCLLFLFFFSSMTPHACLQGYTQSQGIPNGIAAIRFNLFAQKRKKHCRRRG